MWHSCCQKNTHQWIKTAFFLNLWFAIIEVIWWILTNSVSILSDAIHDFGDSITLWLSRYFEKKSAEWPSIEYSYWKRRFSLLSSVINSCILLLWSIFIIKEAIERLISPEAVNAEWMILLAILWIAVNWYAVYRLQWGKWLNNESVRLHLMEDVIGRVAILIVSIILVFYDIPQLDTILWIWIAIYVIFHAIKILKSAISLFLQKSPINIDIKEIEANVLGIQWVLDIHHVHLWSLDGDKHVFTSHVLVDSCNLDNAVEIKKSILDSLHPYWFEHTTIELEFSKNDCSQQ